jgi:hypothetical protein
VTQFLCTTKTLVARRNTNGRSNALFDWSYVVSWAFQPPRGDDLEVVLEFAASIDRLAIVHHRAWNRQAAWLAALLRTRNCRVRSYQRKNYGRAVDWLGRSDCAF